MRAALLGVTWVVHGAMQLQQERHLWVLQVLASVAIKMARPQLQLKL